MSLDPKLLKFSTASPNIVSYSYTDIAEGTGIINFKGFSTHSSTATTYALSTNDLYSGTVSTKTGHTALTINFDTTPFNRPQTAKGVAYISAGIGGTNGQTPTITCTVYKNTTAISSGITTGAVTTDGTTGNMVLIAIPLTETHFSVGDYLRLKVVLSASSGAGDYHELGHDPKGRDTPSYITGADVTTELNFFVPFRIED